MTQSSIHIRTVQAAELSAIANLDRLSFSPLATTAEMEQKWYGGSTDLPGRQLFLAIDETEAAVGSYAQLELELWFEGQRLPGMGLSAVAVAPHRRGQRIARLMLDHALEAAKAQDLAIIALYPFQQGFYRKLGWAWVGQTRQYRVASRDLPVYPERSGIMPYHESHQDSLKQVYEKAASLHNGWLQRQEWQWQQHLKPANGREIYVYTDGSQISGYVRLQFVRLPPHNRLAIAVEEWIALTAEAYRGIIGFLASLRDQISTMIWNTNVSDPFPHLLKEQRHDPMLTSEPFHFGLIDPFGIVGNGIMWRLIDVQRAFELRSIQPIAPFSLTFQITDPIWDQHTISVDFVDENMICHNRSTPATLKTSIEHLTELYSGVRRSRELLWTGEIEFEGDRSLLAQLDLAWQATPPFCWDFF